MGPFSGVSHVDQDVDQDVEDVVLHALCLFHLVHVLLFLFL